MLKRFLRNTDATAAVEAAIFLPFFMLLSFGIVDLGSAMFVRQQANAAAQAGATYALINSSCTPTPCVPVCLTLTPTCLSGIQTAMNDASGNSAFCSTPGNLCTPAIRGCDDGAPKCIIVTASQSLTPIVSATYAWAQLMIVSYTVTLRIV